MRQVTGYCGFCGVHCPTVTTVDGHRVISVEPDRSHPFGGAICAKGRAAPEFHEHGHRVDFPMRRTRPKTDPDPGWERCSWDEALELIARTLLEVRASSGPEAVAFNKGTTGGTGLTDTERWLHRLVHLFGTPNLGGTTHLCQWPRDTGAAHYTFGTPSLAMPDVPRSRCIVLWGASPTGNFLTLGIDITAAKARGATLLVIDPRRAGLANKADLWLQVRPGTDGALALGLIHLADPGRPLRRAVRARVDERAAAGARRHRRAAHPPRPDRRAGGAAPLPGRRRRPRRPGVLRSLARDVRGGRAVRPPRHVPRPARRRPRGHLPASVRAAGVDRGGVPARGRGADHRRAGGKGRRRSPAAGRPPAGLALLPQRPRPAHQRHAGVQGHRDPLRAARRFRLARRQRAGDRPEGQRRRGARGAPGRDGRPTPRPRGAAHRPAGHAGDRHRVRPVPGDPGGPALPAARSRLVRRQHAARQRRHAARSRRPRAARVLRADRAGPHADQPVRGRAAAGLELDGVLRAEGRPSLPDRDDGAHPVPRGRRTAAARAPVGRGDRVRPGAAARPRRRVLGRRHRRRLPPRAGAEWA